MSQTEPTPLSPEQAAAYASMTAAGIVISPSPGPVTVEPGGAVSGHALPTPEELEADAEELRADRAKTSAQVEALLAACRANPRVLAKLAAFVDLAAEAGKKALGEAVERAPELLGHALGALLEGELAKRLPR